MSAIVVKKRRENKLQELQEEINIAVDESILITRVQNNFTKVHINASGKGIPNYRSTVYMWAGLGITS